MGRKCNTRNSWRITVWFPQKQRSRSEGSKEDTPNVLVVSFLCLIYDQFWNTGFLWRRQENKSSRWLWEVGDDEKCWCFRIFILPLTQLSKLLVKTSPQDFINETNTPTKLNENSASLTSFEIQLSLRLYSAVFHFFSPTFRYLPNQNLTRAENMWTQWSSRRLCLLQPFERVVFDLLYNRGSVFCLFTIDFLFMYVINCFTAYWQGPTYSRECISQWCKAIL